MPPMTRGQIMTQIENLFPDNATMEISPTDLRAVFVDVIDSLIFPSELVADIDTQTGSMAWRTAGVTDARVNELIGTFMAAAVTANSETGITVEYIPLSRKLNFVVTAGGGGGISLAEAIAAVAIDDAAVKNIQLTRTSGATHVTIGLAEVVLTHVRYFGWSPDRIIQTADLAGANTSQTDSGTFPTETGQAYLWFAVPADVGWPDHLHLAGAQRDHLDSFEQLSATVDDSLGEDHVIGVSFFTQSAAAYAGEAIDLIYNP